jgi:hypothetical protein
LVGLIFGFLILSISDVNATNATYSGKQVLILDIPRFDLGDVSPQYPNFMKLAQGGSVGMMATPLPDPLTLEKVYLSFNSGAQVKATTDANLIYNSRETYQGELAGAFYRKMIGIQAPADGALNLSFPKLVQLNDPALQPSLGLFGRLLHEQGLQTAAIGNADADIVNRSGAAMLMDQNGIIDLGAVGRETLTADPLFPYGLRTNCNQIFDDWSQWKDEAQVVVITLGDLERIERLGVYLDKTRWEEYRKLTMCRYDDFLGRLLPKIDFKHTMLLVFTALPPGKELTSGSRLTPVIAKGPGLRAGLLSSNSTRRKGIVTCYDLPLSILGFLNIKTQGAYNGYPLESTPGAWRSVITEQTKLIENYNLRWPLLTGYAYLLIGIFLTGIIGLIFGFKQNLIRRLQGSYLFLVTLPAVFLLESLADPLNWAGISLWTLGLSGLIFTCSFLGTGRNFFKTLAVLSWITVAAITIDGLFNGYCELKSFLGYSAVAGARFYGIGNEYLGFLLGAYIVAVSLSLNQIKRYSSQILWAGVFLITIILIHPGLGSSIGGGITAFVGLSVTTCLWLKRPLRLKMMMRLAVALIIIFSLVVCWDYYLNKNSMTHLGQLITSLANGNFHILSEMVSRKLQLNLRLINYSIWGQVLIGILIVIPLIYKRPPQAITGFFEKYPGISRGFLGLVIAAIVGLVINDSGIVTAATMFIFGVIMLFIAIAGELGSQTNQ